MSFNEWDERIEILKTIKEGNYELYLGEAEKELKRNIAKYDSESFFALLNFLIRRHNFNIYCLYYNPAFYKKEIHISLKLLLTLPVFYYYNVEIPGKQKVSNYELEMKDLVENLKRIELIYYYYSLRNSGKDLFTDEEMYYLNYFHNYNFNYDEITLKEYENFFYENSDICKKVFNDEQFEKSLELISNLQVFETFNLPRLYSFFAIPGKKREYMNPEKDVFLLYRIDKVKTLLRKKKINFKSFTDRYFYNLEKRSSGPNLDLLECIEYLDNKIGVIFKKHIFFPRNYYILDKLYQSVWRSDDIIKNLANGKNIKSDMQENLIMKILVDAFGEDKVYSQCYLRKKKGEFAEKDFIILYKEYVISIEAKSMIVPSPCRNFSEGIVKLKEKYQKSISAAIKQSQDLKNAIETKNAHIFRSNKKPHKEILDLSNFDSNKFLTIAITFEGFLNIETNPEFLWAKEKNDLKLWITDVSSFRQILERTVCKNKGDMFIKYIENRQKGYGVVNVQQGEEVKAFNLFCNMPIIYEKDARNTGISIII